MRASVYKGSLPFRYEQDPHNHSLLWKELKARR
jgi:hypothetical protein